MIERPAKQRLRWSPETFKNFKLHPANIKKMIKLMENTTIEMPKDHDASACNPSLGKRSVFVCQTTRDIKQQQICTLIRHLGAVLRGNASQDQIGQVLQCHAQRQRQPIKVIKGAAYKFESHKNIYLALDNAKCTFYAYLQAPDETNANFMSKFKNTIEVIKHYGGAIGEDKALLLE
jgi:hypothetical protein